MHQIVSVLIAITLVLSLSTKCDAKRGCAYYGHSCYGGHGKRSDGSMQTQPTTPLLLNNEYRYDALNRMAQEPNKEYPFATDNLQLFNGNPTDMQEVQDREYRYAVYNVIKQLMDNAKIAQKSNYDSGDSLY